MRKHRVAALVLALFVCAGSAFAGDTPRGRYAEGEALVLLESAAAGRGPAAFEPALSASANSVASSVGALVARTYGALADDDGRELRVGTEEARTEYQGGEHLHRRLGGTDQGLGEAPLRRRHQGALGRRSSGRDRGGERLSGHRQPRRPRLRTPTIRKPTTRGSCRILRVSASPTRLPWPRSHRTERAPTSPTTARTTSTLLLPVRPS